jgi:hypothetical protein
MTNTAPAFTLTRPPKTSDELWWTVKALWGVELPRVKVCPDHTAPFDAFAEAYFGNEFNWVLWYGSRGTGKSYMLAILALTKAALLEINVTLLGGSMAQSQNIHEHVESLLQHHNAPRYAIANQIKTQITFTGGNWIRPLPASQKTVRGPHPQMTLLDEIDEMERKIYDAAMGQAMTKPNARGVEIDEMVVASSTWQNPVGTFSSVMEEAQKKGMPVRTWCYREQLKPHGWMDADFIERKRMSVPAEMFRVEYELGEPAGGSRAFDLEKLNRAFVDFEIVDENHSGNDDEWVFEKPETNGTYSAGADWAKEQDKTVIAIFRLDVQPRKLVYYRRFNRKSWPEMIEAFNRVTSEYQAMAAHDATGIGNVVHDMVDERVIKFTMSGPKRTEMLTNYVTAIERGKYRLPRNTPAYNQHKSTTVEEVYGQGGWKSHLSDDVCAFALAHHAAERMAPPASGEGVKKTDELSKKFEPITPVHEEDGRYTTQTGDVSIKGEDGVGTFWL